MENLYKNLTTEEELELCYKYFLKMVSGEVSGAVTEGFNDRFYNANNSFVDTFYGFLVALRGFDKFPTVVSDEIYDKNLFDVIEGQYQWQTRLLNGENISENISESFLKVTSYYYNNPEDLAEVKEKYYPILRYKLYKEFNKNNA